MCRGSQQKDGLEHLQQSVENETTKANMGFVFLGMKLKNPNPDHLCINKQ
jgi:hypothetical protein